MSLPVPDGNETVTVSVRATLDDLTAETTVELGGSDAEADRPAAFGQLLSSFVKSLLDEEREGGIGQTVSEYARENNPGADNRPDHAGPPEDRGNATGKPGDADRRGPPADRGNKNASERGGPPADAGPSTNQETDSDEDDDSGNGNGKGNANGRDGDHPGKGSGNGRGAGR